MSKPCPAKCQPSDICRNRSTNPVCRKDTKSSQVTSALNVTHTNTSNEEIERKMQRYCAARLGVLFIKFQFLYNRRCTYKMGVACNAAKQLSFFNKSFSRLTTDVSRLTALSSIFTLHSSLPWRHHAAITAAALATFKLSAPRLHWPGIASTSFT